jgi:hypothetical protein
MFMSLDTFMSVEIFILPDIVFLVLRNAVFYAFISSTAFSQNYIPDG